MNVLFERKYFTRPTIYKEIPTLLEKLCGKFSHTSLTHLKYFKKIAKKYHPKRGQHLQIAESDKNIFNLSHRMLRSKYGCRYKS